MWIEAGFNCCFPTEVAAGNDIVAYRRQYGKQMAYLGGLDKRALAAQVGGLGMAPGANMGDTCAVFEATHGTAPKYAGLDKVNPGSVILSGEIMFRHLGWAEAADLIVKGLEASIADKIVTYDFARLMDEATEVKTSEFGEAVIARM